MAIWLMRLAYWIRKATNTHSEYVIHIALPLKQWLHERASMLRYRGANKSSARPTSRCIFFMVRIFRLTLGLLYIYIYIYI